jgi:hypothetical protein
MPMKYVVFVGYENDEERKRVDYLLEKWSERANIQKPRGVVFLIETQEAQEFLEELYSKLEGNVEEKVEVYLVEGVVRKVEARRRSVEYTFREERKVVEKFLEYLFSKINATYAYSDALAKVYKAYTRKGRVTLKVLLREGKKTHVSIEVEGFGEAVDFLAERIDEELRLFSGG